MYPSDDMREHVIRCVRVSVCVHFIIITLCVHEKLWEATVCLCRGMCDIAILSTVTERARSLCHIQGENYEQMWGQTRTLMSAMAKHSTDLTALAQSVSQSLLWRYHRYNALHPCSVESMLMYHAVLCALFSMFLHPLLFRSVRAAQLAFQPASSIHCR